MISPVVALIITEAVKYGPDFVISVINALKKTDATIADVEALFANVKPYDSYGIPSVVPKV